MEVAALPSKIGPRHPLRMEGKSAAAVTCLLVTCLSAACGTAAPSAVPLMLDWISALAGPGATGWLGRTR